MNALCLHAFFARVFPPCATNGPLKEQIACKSPSSPSFRCTAEWGMDKALPSEKNVCVELIANVVVAVVKLYAALFTASASMAAEAVHSIVDVVLVALSFFTLGSGFSMAEGVRR
jgi:Co/Zn/Cd efflux system component